MKKTSRDIYNEIVTENEQYTVVLLGGSIGSKSIRSVRDLKGDSLIADDMVFDDKEDAKAKAKRMNKMLSPGEKKYYGLKYTVATIVNGKYTGK